MDTDNQKWGALGKIGMFTECLTDNQELPKPCLL